MSAGRHHTVGGVVNDKQDPGTVAESFVSQEKLG
jgi:hypothetical protein